MERTDHDLLIEIKTTLNRAVQDIRDLRDGTSMKIDNHEKRIEVLEKKLYADGSFDKLIVGMGILILGLVVWHLTGYKL
jgi:hypothetical protein